MPPARSTVKSLRRLQATVRAEDPPDAQPGLGRKVPQDLATEDFKWLQLTREESELFDEAIEEMLADITLEHLRLRKTKDAVWRMVCSAVIDRQTDHVTPLLGTHAREPVTREVFFTIRHLEILDEFGLAGARFVPPSSPGLPASKDLLAEPHVLGVVSTTAAGTDAEKIVGRARATAEHALTILRLGLWVVARSAASRQLRFRLGERFAFDNSRMAGWRVLDDTAWELGVDAATVAKIAAAPMAALDARPLNNLERHLHTAMLWIDRAMVTPDALLRVLYLFFALEALVGDAGEGKKATLVAFRRAMLDHMTSGGFRNPHLTYRLYDRVRSAAVHGEEPPTITDKYANGFLADVLAALTQLIEFAASLGATKHGTVMRALDEHPEAAGLVSWMQSTDPWEAWSTFEPRKWRS